MDFGIVTSALERSSTRARISGDHSCTSWTASEPRPEALARLASRISLGSIKTSEAKQFQSWFMYSCHETTPPTSSTCATEMY